jgi:hypothetical protein
MKDEGTPVRSFNEIPMGFSHSTGLPNSSARRTGRLRQVGQGDQGAHAAAMKCCGSARPRQAGSGALTSQGQQAEQPDGEEGDRGWQR